MVSDTTIYHIALDKDIAEYQETGEYRCGSLSSEGFIHCCDAGQLDGVVNRYYQGIDDVQLMLIDPDKLDSPLILENTVGGSELFAHVYGVINAEAVKSIEPFGLASIQRQGLND